MNENRNKGIISYFANNSVAANLIMMFIIIMGIVNYLFMQRQLFPNTVVNYINVSINHPGKSPQEIEKNILIKVEESIKDVAGIKKVVSYASRGSANISIKVDRNVDINRVLIDIKQRVDNLSNMPAGMESINVYQVEWQQDVIQMSLVGDRSLEELKPLAQQIKNELLQLKNVMLVELDAPEEEITIEVDPLVLRKYDLTLNDVSQAIGRYSTNLSAGELKTHSGIISMRIENKQYNGQDFFHIPIKLGDNGEQVLLQDIATIKDGLTEGERYFKNSGQNMLYLAVKATRDQNIIPIAESAARRSLCLILASEHGVS